MGVVHGELDKGVVVSKMEMIQRAETAGMLFFRPLVCICHKGIVEMMRKNISKRVNLSFLCDNI